ncbi:6-pyruvoyl tetrahydropterin synthase family protein [Telluria sp. Tellsp104]|jgi:6-pyruvoyltetrahydropterin/6-carboxytetrahydropterin synthase
MNYELSQKFFFEAAHTLERAIDAAGSRRIHGHTYHAEITLAGTPDANGMVADLGFVRKEIARVRDLLDHRFLDEVAGLGPATLENLCRFIYQALVEALPALTRVSVERQASGDRCCLSKS